MKRRALCLLLVLVLLVSLFPVQALAAGSSSGGDDVLSQILEAISLFFQKINPVRLVEKLIEWIEGLFTKEEPKPEETVMEFVECLNAFDVDGMLDCLEPRMARAAKAAVRLAGGLFGFDLQSILEIMPIAIPFLSGYGGMAYNVDCQILSTDYSADGNTAIVHVTMSADITQDGQTQNQSATGAFYMVKDDGTWYIRGIE